MTDEPTELGTAKRLAYADPPYLARPHAACDARIAELTAQRDAARHRPGFWDTEALAAAESALGVAREALESAVETLDSMQTECEEGHVQMAHDELIGAWAALEKMGGKS